MRSFIMWILLVLGWTCNIKGTIEPYNSIIQQDIPEEDNLQRIRAYCNSFIIRLTIVISRMFGLPNISKNTCEEHGF